MKQLFRKNKVFVAVFTALILVASSSAYLNVQAATMVKYYENHDVLAYMNQDLVVFKAQVSGTIKLHTACYTTNGSSNSITFKLYKGNGSINSSTVVATKTIYTQPASNVVIQTYDLCTVQAGQTYTLYMSAGSANAVMHAPVLLYQMN